jgi:hypothetical protein
MAYSRVVDRAAASLVQPLGRSAVPSIVVDLAGMSGFSRSLRQVNT